MGTVTAINPRWTPPKPPSGLGKPGRDLWAWCVTTWELEPHELTRLTAACRMVDRAEQARRQVRRDGAFQTDRFGQLKAHPGIDVERNSTIAALRALREMGLDELPEATVGRPPTIGRKP